MPPSVTGPAPSAAPVARKRTRKRHGAQQDSGDTSSTTPTRTPASGGATRKLSDQLWEQVVRYHAKASDYVHRREWLGSYYNTRLAITACEHYLLVCRDGSAAVSETHIGHAQRFRTAADITLERTNARAACTQLRSTIPAYEQRLRTFQCAFGCPPSVPTTTATSSSHEGCADSSSARALDCSNMHEIELDDTARHPKVLFSDIIGNTTAKHAVEDTLIHPVLMPHLYTDRTRALLFYGPPGTGKTLLAKATAHELNQRRDNMRVLFFAPTADEFKGKYVGETEEKIVRMFRCASQKAKAVEQSHANTAVRAVSIIFIDEIDSLAKRRDIGGGASGSAAVASATNALLQVMDGIEAFENVVVLAATNYPWEMDSAVLRRFGQKIHVSLPTEGDIHALLRKKIVGQLRRVLLADGGSVARQNRVQRLRHAYSQRTDEDLFFRWQTLHGMTDADVQALAGEMWASASASSSAHGGFAPRDIDRMCELAFRVEAQNAQASSEGFFPVRLLTNRQSHQSFSEHAEELLSLVEGLHVSASTFALLRKTYSWAIDTSVRPEHTEDHSFPQQLTLHEGERHVLYTGWSHILPTTQKVDSLVVNVDIHRDVRDKYHVYLHEEPRVTLNGDTKQRVLFLLYRTFRVATQRQMHDVPVFLTGSVIVPNKKKMYTLEVLLEAVDVIRFVYDGNMHQTRTVDENGKKTCAHVRTSVLGSKGTADPLSVVNEQEKWWWTGVKNQMSIVKQLAAGATQKWFGEGPSSHGDPASDEVPVSEWVNRLFVKGCSRPSVSTLRDPNIAANVNETVRVEFSSTPHQDHDDSAPGDRRRTSGTEMRCAHLTCNMQTLLDARHEVQPSTTKKTIMALLEYQRTGESPSNEIPYK